MAIFNLLFQTKRAAIGGQTIDATLRESHESSCAVTENPVEDGANVTDHVQLQPATLTIEGVITDTPTGFSVLDNATGLVRSIAERTVGNKSRSLDGYETLLALQKAREPFDVVTGLRKYRNMVIEELNVPRTAKAGKAIQFTAKLREIVIAQSKTVGLALAKDVVQLGAPIVDVGRKVTSVVPATNPIAAGSSAISAVAQQTKGASKLFKGMQVIREWY